MKFLPNCRRWFAATCVICAVALSGCAETQLAAHSYKQISGSYNSASSAPYKVGKPYRVMGVNYTPHEDWDYSETGVASWYGPDFHGKPTASGERYDQWEMTAAHKTLPLPSIVTVTNLENGRSVKLKVNDRGPFAHGRVIDVSRRAAEVLDFANKGTAKVRVEIDRAESLALKQQLTGETMMASNTAPTPAYDTARRTIAAPEPIIISSETIGNGEPLLPARVEARPLEARNEAQNIAASPVQERRLDVAVSGLESQPASPLTQPQNGLQDPAMYVQIGSFQSQENAQRLSNDMARLGNVTVSPALVNGQNFYRVRVGPLADVIEADAALEKAIRLGYRNARIIVDDNQQNLAYSN